MREWITLSGKSVWWAPADYTERLTELPVHCSSTLGLYRSPLWVGFVHVPFYSALVQETEVWTLTTKGRLPTKRHLPVR